MVFQRCSNGVLSATLNGAQMRLWFVVKSSFKSSFEKTQKIDCELHT